MSTHGNWAPKALKGRDGKYRRGTEFNMSGSSAAQSKPQVSSLWMTVDAPSWSGAPVAAPEPSASTEKPSTAAAAEEPSAAAESWGGAADLEELEEEKAEPAPKRARVEGGGDGGADAGSSSADAKPEGPPRDEVLEGAPRLAQHIKSAAKFTKVAAMAYSLLEGGRVTRANAAAFFEVLEAGMANPTRLRDAPLRVAYRRLYTAALAREALFSSLSARHASKMGEWRLRVLTQLDVYTDDTYQFGRACKAVRAALEKLPCVYAALEPKEGALGGAPPAHLAEAERPPWVAACFDCVEAAMEHHKYPWAKSMVDTLVQAAADRRQNFSETEQRVLGEWVSITKGQRVQRQQAAARAKEAEKGYEATSFEAKEAEWQKADLAMNKGGAEGPGGLDNWMAKQANN